MTSVMLSLRPYWAFCLFSGVKTLELRKSFPGRLPRPFKVAVYCSSARLRDSEREIIAHDKWFHGMGLSRGHLCYGSGPLNCCPMEGQVVGAFICDGVDTLTSRRSRHQAEFWTKALAHTCASNARIEEYFGMAIRHIDRAILWHIKKPMITLPVPIEVYTCKQITQPHPSWSTYRDINEQRGVEL